MGKIDLSTLADFVFSAKKSNPFDGHPFDFSSNSLDYKFVPTEGTVWGYEIVYSNKSEIWHMCSQVVDIIDSRVPKFLTDIFHSLPEERGKGLYLRGRDYNLIGGGWDDFIYHAPNISNISNFQKNDLVVLRKSNVVVYKGLIMGGFIKNKPLF